jgi:hypothetical protein
MSDRPQELIDDRLGDEVGDWVECWNCGGEGRLPGCFEDTCVCGGDEDVDCRADFPHFRESTRFADGEGIMGLLMRNGYFESPAPF